uniref:Uncharacterized protein n=1 Tax=Anopheles christyi TaxID=43041 RepID=A0A182KI74_9DIPT
MYCFAYCNASWPNMPASCSFKNMYAIPASPTYKSPRWSVLRSGFVFSTIRFTYDWISPLMWSSHRWIGPPP